MDVLQFRLLSMKHVFFNACSYYIVSLLHRFLSNHFKFCSQFNNMTWFHRLNSTKCHYISYFRFSISIDFSHQNHAWHNYIQNEKWLSHLKQFLNSSEPLLAFSLPNSNFKQCNNVFLKSYMKPFVLEIFILVPSHHYKTIPHLLVNFKRVWNQIIWHPPC